jgi:uncharacterized protein YycO
LNRQKGKASKHPAGEGQIYALDTNALKVGDIVLISQKGFASWAIRAGTSSTVSHAAVVTRQGMLLEAQPEGVRRRSALSTFATKREWIAVLRPKFQVERNTQGRSFALCAETRYGWAYSKVRAIGSAWPGLSKRAGWLDGTFCSELVALAYADYGVDLLPGVRRSAITPEKLKQSPVVTDVTASCIRVVHPVRDAEAYHFALRLQGREEPKKDMELERQCLKRLHASKCTPKSTRSLHDAFVWLASLDMKVPAGADLDTRIQELLDQEGYFEFYENIANELHFGTKPFSDGIVTAQSLSAADFNSEINKFLSDLRAMLPIFEEHFNARIDSCETIRRLAINGSDTLARVLDVQEKMAARAAILRRDRRGLVAELDSAALR